MIYLYGVKRIPDVMAAIRETGLVYKRDFDIKDSVSSLTFVPEGSTIIVCGKKYVPNFGFKIGKVGDSRCMTFYAPTIDREVFFATNPNASAYNPNVLPQFIADLKQIANIKTEGINLEPNIIHIGHPDELQHNAGRLAFDLETTGLTSYVRYRFPASVDTIRFILFAKDYDNCYMLDTSMLHQNLAAWRTYFAKKNIEFVTHNGKFDIIFLRRETGIRVKVGFDTIVANHRLRAEEQHGLEHILSTRYGFPLYSSWIDQYVYVDRVTGDKNYSNVPLPIFHKYGALDGVGTLRLADDLEDELNEAGMLETFHVNDMPFLNAIAKNEFLGRNVDMQFLAMNRNKVLIPIIEQAKHKLRGILGNPSYNPNSHPQNKDAVYSLGMDSSNGTAAKEVDKLLGTELSNVQRDFLETLMEYRGAEKIRSSYVDNLGNMVSIDGKVFPVLNQIGTIIDRTSQTSPALQTLPKTPAGKFIRQAYVAPEGYAYTHIDGGSSQMRIAANLSGDEAMLDVFNNHRDMHDNTLEAIIKYLPQRYQDDAELARRVAKAVNFGKLFGQSPWGLHNTFPYIPMKSCTMIHMAFNNAYPQYTRWQELEMNKVRQVMYQKNLLGHLRTYQVLNYHTESQAANYPMISNEAMVFNSSYTELTQMGYHVAMHLHDELAILHKIEDAEVVAYDMTRTIVKNYLRIIGNSVVWVADGETKLRWNTLTDDEQLHTWRLESKIGDSYEQYG